MSREMEKKVKRNGKTVKGDVASPKEM